MDDYATARFILLPLGVGQLLPEDVPSWMGGTRDASRAGSLDDGELWTPVSAQRGGQHSPPRPRGQRSPSPDMKAHARGDFDCKRL